MRRSPAQSEGAGLRKRKFHKKSRDGCRNCKLRRVKCDEVRPKCKKCHSYGVLCDYGSSAVDLRMPKEVVMPVLASGADDKTDDFALDSQCIDLLTKFGFRTVSSIVNLGNGDVVELAVSNSYLMHAILAVTAMHDRFLSSSPLAAPTRRESYHSSQSAALFNRKLSRPIPPQDRDPLWMTATFLGIIAFSSDNPVTPEEAWPLNVSGLSDLEWLRMTEAKMAIWQLANPLQPGSLFRNMAEELEEMYTSLPATPIEEAPLALRDLCHLTPSSSATNNPYYTAVQTLVPVLDTETKGVTRAKALSFTSRMQGEFRALLHERDPLALLLLALWYEKSRHLVWWMWHRATIECQAISLYIERYHRHNATIMELLPCI